MTIMDIPNPFDAPVYRFETVESTMLEALRLVKERKAPHGTIVIADFQSAGQARIQGRRWTSPAGESLLFTLMLNLDVSVGFIPIPYSLLAGIALCKILKSFAPGAQVKWPNDVLLSGRKCAGILTRVSGKQLYLGVGVNCLQQYFSGEYNYPPTSIFLSSGQKILPETLLPLFLREFYRSLEKGWNPQEFAGYLYGMGSQQVVCSGLPGYEEEVEGVIIGVDEKGELLISDKGTGKIHALSAGEIPDQKV